MKNIDELLNRHIDCIAARLLAAEQEYFKIAGQRLLEISELDIDKAKEYLYSGEFLEDVNKDLGKLKRLMNKAHRENVQELLKLFSGITSATYETGKVLKEAAE
jgi:hypothetical protein